MTQIWILFTWGRLSEGFCLESDAFDILNDALKILGFISERFSHENINWIQFELHAFPTLFYDAFDLFFSTHLICFYWRIKSVFCRIRSVIWRILSWNFRLWARSRLRRFCSANTPKLFPWVEPQMDSRVSELPLQSISKDLAGWTCSKSWAEN